MTEFYDHALYSVKPIVARRFGKAHQDSPDYQLSIKGSSKEQNTNISLSFASNTVIPAKAGIQCLCSHAARLQPSLE